MAKVSGRRENNCQQLLGTRHCKTIVQSGKTHCKIIAFWTVHFKHGKTELKKILAYIMAVLVIVPVLVLGLLTLKIIILE